MEHTGTFGRSLLRYLLFFALLLLVLAEEETDSAVTYGSSIKLENPSTKFRLTSQQVNYGTGSGQQSVTALMDSGTSRLEDLFTLRGEGGRADVGALGQVIECGAVIRLRHVATHRHLHSHGFRAPLSGEQEVSGFDGTDTLDHWRVICDRKGKSGEDVWLRSKPIRLQHVVTSVYLTHDQRHRYPQPLTGHVEVRGTRDTKGSEGLWQAVEGLFVEEE